MRRSPLPFLLVALCLPAGCGEKSEPEKGAPVSAEQTDPSQPRLNRLANEKSEYLRQHATNPVDWYPWGEEAFEKARRENKPIFLSIGYSSCHWCHVMEHECFEDEEVAAVLNEHFVSIKVDREERPDVDEVYMLAAQLIMRGGGGWPLSVWLTPDKQPFFAGTYFPKQARQGMPGFLDLLKNIAAIWDDAGKRERVLADGQRLADYLREFHDDTEAEAIGPAQLSNGAAMAAAQVDPEFGGFGSQPKFPSPSSLELLLRGALREKNDEWLGMVTRTLDRMARGGIHDHLGGGFHRYSVTRDWRVPHFEKMLYDNGQLLGLYAWAWLVTKQELYADTAADIAQWVRREMTGPGGGFFAAQDADDPGGPEGEGGFYVWDPAAIRALFEGKEAEVVLAYFNVSDEGNWPERPGKTILEHLDSFEEVARRTSTTPEEVERIVARARARMYEEREKRPKPVTDKKVLAGWNGLMISGLAKAYQAFGDESYLDLALRAARFLKGNLERADGRLMRRWAGGEAAHAAVLDDYAYVIAAWLDLYESTFDPAWLEDALRLERVVNGQFADAKGAGFFFTAHEAEPLLARGKPHTDNARPSGNGVMAMNLLRLAELTGDAARRERALETLAAFGGRIGQWTLGAGALLNAADFAHSRPRSIFLAGDPDEPATRALVRAVWRDPDPNRVLALVTPGIGRLLPPAEGKTPVEGRPAAYVCRGFVCAAPVTDPAELVPPARK